MLTVEFVQKRKYSKKNLFRVEDVPGRIYRRNRKRTIERSPPELPPKKRIKREEMYVERALRDQNSFFMDAQALVTNLVGEIHEEAFFLPSYFDGFKPTKGVYQFESEVTELKGVELLRVLKHANNLHSKFFRRENSEFLEPAEVPENF